MMKYEVKITDEALADMEKIYEYIANLPISALYSILGMSIKPVNFSYLPFLFPQHFS